MYKLMLCGDSSCQYKRQFHSYLHPQYIYSVNNPEKLLNFKLTSNDKFCAIFIGGELLNDEDRARWANALQLAMRKGLVIRLLNNPENVLHRATFLKHPILVQINKFDIHEFHTSVENIKLPCFLRGYSQGSMLSAELYNSRESLIKAIADCRNNVGKWIVEFDRKLLSDEIHTKIGLFRFYDFYFIAHVYRSRHWCVRGYNRLDDIESAILELKTISSFNVTNDIASAFEIAGVNYGRADIGVFEDGISIYEIGSAPVIDPDLFNHTLSEFPKWHFQQQFSRQLTNFLQENEPNAEILIPPRTTE